MNGVSSLNESTVEDAALAYLEGLGWGVAHGPDIAPDTLGAERADYGDVVLGRRLRDALVRLNSDLPAGALDDAFRKLTRLEGTSLAFRNRAFHRLMVDGVTVEHRDADGSVRGARVGTLTAGREWFKPWHTISGEGLADSNMSELQVMLEGVCDVGRFLSLVRDFVVFEDDGSGVLVKKMAGYHQFHAVRVAVGETRRAVELQQAGRGVAEGAGVMNRDSSRGVRRVIGGLGWCGIRRGRVRV